MEVTEPYAIEAQIAQATPCGTTKSYLERQPTLGSILRTALHKAVSQQKASAYQASYKQAQISPLTSNRIKCMELLQSLKPSVAQESWVFESVSRIDLHFFIIGE